MTDAKMKDKISIDEVDYIARLARLKIKAADKPIMQQQLSRILDYIEKLNKLDTENTAPTAHVLPLNNVFREDEVKASLTQDIALDNAPDKEGNFFRVPRVID